MVKGVVKLWELDQIAWHAEFAGIGWICVFWSQHHEILQGLAYFVGWEDKHWLYCSLIFTCFYFFYIALTVELETLFLYLNLEFSQTFLWKKKNAMTGLFKVSRNLYQEKQ